MWKTGSNLEKLSVSKFTFGKSLRDDAIEKQSSSHEFQASKRKIEDDKLYLSIFMAPFMVKRSRNKNKKFSKSKEALKNPPPEPTRKSARLRKKEKNTERREIESSPTLTTEDFS